jgi:hypothetical protein
VYEVYSEIVSPSAAHTTLPPVPTNVRATRLTTYTTMLEWSAIDQSVVTDHQSDLRASQSQRILIARQALDGGSWSIVASIPITDTYFVVDEYDERLKVYIICRQEEDTFACAEALYTSPSLPPVVNGIDVSTAVAGSDDVILHITGRYFPMSAIVRFGTHQLPARVENPSQLEVTLPRASLVTAGRYPISVVDPFTGVTLMSNSIFTVENKVPIISQVTSPGASLRNMPLFVTGSQFAPNAYVVWNGVPVLTKWINATQLQAWVDGSLLAGHTTGKVMVVNAEPGGGASSTLPQNVFYRSLLPFLQR